jgi:hypothetical protein
MVCVCVYHEVPCYRLVTVSRILDIIIFFPNSYPLYVASYIKGIIEVYPPRFPNQELHFSFSLLQHIHSVIHHISCLFQWCFLFYFLL